MAEFLAGEIFAGRVPKSFLPIQSGVGDIANAVLGALGKHPGDSSIRDVHGSAAGFRDPADEERAGEVCQQLLAHRQPRHAAAGLRQPGMVPLTHSAAAAGNQQQPGSDPPPGHHLHEHGHRGGYLRQRKQHPRHGPPDDERHRRLGRFHAQRVSIGFHLPVDGQGRQDLAPSCPLVSHMDHSEHSVQIVATEHGIADLRGTFALRARHADHPELRASRFPRGIERLPGDGGRRPYAANVDRRVPDARAVLEDRRHARRRLGLRS